MVKLCLEMDAEQTSSVTRPSPDNPHVIVVEVLLIHGTADKSVPVEMGRALYAAFSKFGSAAELVEIDKADHLLRNSKHMSKAMRAVAAFVTKVALHDKE